jgi:HK97 family phage portal protein
MTSSPPSLYAVGNGIKQINLEQLHSWAELGNVPWAANPDTHSPTQLVAFVAFLYRAIEIRANSVSTVPWTIYTQTGERSVWTSDEPVPPPALEWLKELQELLYRTEASLTMVSEAFLLRERNRIKTTALRWLDPQTMEPVWTKDGLKEFRRTANGMPSTLPVEDVVYLWYRGLSETEPKSSPVMAALSAANALYSIDAFVKSFFNRGAVKATLLTTKSMPLQAEAARLKDWWQRTITGSKNAFASEVVSAEVVPVVIGEGITELSNNSLTTEKREDIATALGVPHSMIMSNAANFATAQADQENFYNTTVLPECAKIEHQLNQQVFGTLGLRFTFRPQSLSIFQQDEAERADAFAKYVAAGVLPSISAQLLGIELPEGYEYADLDPEPPPPAPAPIIVQNTPALPAPRDEDEDEEPVVASQRAIAAERIRFARWAARRKEPDVRTFISDIFSHEEKEALLAEVGIVPFVLTWNLTGSITPEAYRAMVVMLDPDDPEEEQQIRMALERKQAEELAKQMEKQYDSLLPAAEKFDTQAGQIASLEENVRMNQKVQDVLEQTLVKASDLGVAAAVTGLENVSVAFDWTLANTQARAWAARHTGVLVSGIDEATLRSLREATTRWIQNGAPLKSLVNDLAPMFGQSRAEMIASTEVTNAYQQGNEIAWVASDVVDEMEWVTVRDERVCPLCGPMHGKRAPLGGTFEGGVKPPARHPRCRCFTRPVLKKRS